MDAQLITDEYVEGACPFCEKGTRHDKRASGEGITSKDVPHRNCRAYYHERCNRNWEVPMALIRHGEAS